MDGLAIALGLWWLGDAIVKAAQILAGYDK